MSTKIDSDDPGDRDVRKLNKARGNQVKTSKLDEEKVLDIRRRYKRGETQHALARRFGVSGSTIHYVVTRVTWSHLKEE